MNKLGSSLHRTHDIKLNLLNLVINQWSLKKATKQDDLGRVDTYSLGTLWDERRAPVRRPHTTCFWSEQDQLRDQTELLGAAPSWVLKTPKCGDCTARSSLCLHPQGLCTDLFTEEMKQQQGLSQQSLERLQVSSCLIYVMILSPKREAEWSYNCTTLPWNEQHED